QYIYQDNQGAAIARNHACKLAKGEFLAFLDADDFFLPEKLEKQVACFDADPTLDMVQTGWVIVDKNEKGIYGVKPWEEAPKLDLESFVLYKSVRPSAM
ncbi:glycosyltransferase family A protein, partial [Microcoleus sp. HI-ES]|nr:glycosyltransferase family A protein [Microcoleus sp. HI-ES]